MSNKADVLIVSPTVIKFQSPFPHAQKRQLNLLNGSDQEVSFCIEPSNEQLFQVLPAKGKVAAFDTIELTMLMQPTQADVAACSLTIRHQVERKTQSSSDWAGAHTKQMQITFENCLEDEELLRMFDFDGDNAKIIKTLELQYQPICAGCCSKRCNPQAVKISWLQRAMWPAVGLALSILVYIGWSSLGGNKAPTMQEG